ncbi:putative LTR transposable element [Pseudoloma neurophilia]|uniref:Putative LTR transposable element n=1 Tax=Pseudoloma neurophilia TaxID=146866 RepID=A0A0R0LRN2_9MICR|nr:putative LTR transposable element [Pseudoloma neurophilia]
MFVVKNIYDKLVQVANLYYPDFNEPFNINSDASDYAVGAILYQKNGIVSYFSQKLNDAQSRYTSWKKIFTIWKPIYHWKGLINGSKIIVKTDNKNLLCDHSNFDKRKVRWMDG